MEGIISNDWKGNIRMDDLNHDYTILQHRHPYFNQDVIFPTHPKTRRT